MHQRRKGPCCNVAHKYILFLHCLRKKILFIQYKFRIKENMLVRFEGPNCDASAKNAVFNYFLLVLQHETVRGTAHGCWRLVLRKSLHETQVVGRKIFCVYLIRINTRSTWAYDRTEYHDITSWLAGRFDAKMKKTVWPVNGRKYVMLHLILRSSFYVSCRCAHLRGAACYRAYSRAENRNYHPRNRSVK